MILSAGSRVAHRPFPTAQGLALVALLWGSGCHRQLPPAPTPKAVAPDVAPAAVVGQGEGQLLIDVVDGPTPVQQIRMQASAVVDGQGRTRYEFIESPELLCAATPCVVNFPVGNMVLGFPVLGNPDAMDVELVHVALQPTVYRRALTHHRPGRRSGRTLGVVFTALGGTTLATGAALLPVGLGTDSDGLALAGAITLGTGAVVTALGMWALQRSASSYRPGSAIHFSF